MSAAAEERAGRSGVGVDGCRAGWCVVHVVAGDAQPLRFALERADLVEDVARVADHPTPDGVCVAIDIPIGLPAGDATRECDRLAREALGPRRASVFAAPPREVLEFDDYRAANARAKEIGGRGLSVQSFNLVPKIRAVDAWLADDAAARTRVFECHPELCFARFSGLPLVDAKRTPLGRATRLNVLEDLCPGASAALDQLLSRHRRVDLAVDDALDACVLAITAALPPAALESLPVVPPSDARGLPMRIVAPRADWWEERG